MIKSSNKSLISVFIISIIIIVLLCAYLIFIPSIVNSKIIYNKLNDIIKTNTGAEIVVKNPNLVTGLNSKIIFTVEDFIIKNNGKDVLCLKNIDTKFSVHKIFQKKIIVDKILAESVYLDVNELIEILPKTNKSKTKSKEFFYPDIYNALIGVKNCNILYKNSDIDINFKAKHIILDNTKDKKFLHLDIDLQLKNSDYGIEIATSDMNKIVVDKDEITINQLPIQIDNSKIVIDANAKSNMTYKFNVVSKNFSAKDIANIINSNIIINNGNEFIKPLKDINGSVDFSLTAQNGGKLRGDLKVNKVNFKIKDLLDLPVTLSQGLISLDEKNIKIRDFEGYYNNLLTNKLSMNGDIKDYPKTLYLKLVSEIFITDDLFKNYITTIIGFPVNLVGDAKSTLIVESKNDGPNIRWYFLLDEGEGFKLGNQSMVLKDYKTIFKLDVSLIKEILKINTLNYYITSEIKRGMTPLIKMDGNFDLSKNIRLLNLNLEMPRPLPSEFLNFLIGQKVFKKGEVSGEMSIDNHGKFAYMRGKFALDKVLVPSQRIYIKSGIFEAKNDKIFIISDGRFKRSNYSINGYIVNQIKLPIIVKNIELKVDNIDIERLLANNSGQTLQGTSQTDDNITTIDDTNSDVYTFNKGLLIVEKCTLNLIKGVYKQINFSNLIADLTLNENGDLNIKSNRFDIAEGFSTLKVKANLADKKYYLRLGIKDVNADVIATSILSLPREISGKAMGLIELNTDETLKLNGQMKFKINNGSIEKVGYVEYILKVASIFRNPLAMISPLTLGDLVTVPDGQFDLINGELQINDNVIERMMIKSQADKLAAFIIGRYNLETNDAMLRIYTKISEKNSGFGGFLRNISLNSIASKLSLSSRNEANYYSKELSQIPELKSGNESAQVFITKIDGDIINYNFISSLKRIK